MKNKRIVLTLVTALCVAGAVLAGEKEQEKGVRFRTCENVAGSGFFWVDTTCGRVWLVNTSDMTWVPYGAPPPPRTADAGTYIPHENKSGEGLFILNVQTGEAWWTNGGTWKLLGKPI